MVKKIVLILGPVVISVLLLCGGLYIRENKSPVPKSITKSVNFPVYYPEQKNLPKGYKLDTTSFNSPQSGVVVYTVHYGTNQKLVFSVQQKPSDSDLSSFVKNYIPVNRQVLTLAGTATIGAIGQQTVVSLPTSNNSWIIVTGPANIYGTDNLAQVLKALKK